MDEYKIYSITDEYINYLRVAEPNVYSNKQDNRTHTRKYIGTVLEINNMKYFIPMSSSRITYRVLRILSASHVLSHYFLQIHCAQA